MKIARIVVLVVIVMVALSGISSAALKFSKTSKFQSTGTEKLDIQVQREIYLAILCTMSLDWPNGEAFAEFRSHCKDVARTEVLSHDTQGLYGSYIDKREGKDVKNYYFLAVRGTVMTAKSWINNILVNPCSFCGTGTHVHCGFYRGVEALLGDKNVRKTIKQAKADQRGKLIVAGMSQGGADATILGAYLQSQEGFTKDKMAVRVFANPAAGQADFVKKFSPLVDQINIIRENDMVPLLTDILEYRHLGKVIYHQDEYVDVNFWDYHTDDHSYLDIVKGEISTEYVKAIWEKGLV